MTQLSEQHTFLQLINKVQNELKAPKGQFNSFGKYNYRSAEDILEAVKPLLYKYQLTQTISDELVFVGDRYYVKATVTVYYGEQGVSVSAFAREPETKKGMDESQITGTASSYARKYALNGMWCIDDTKDADTDEYKKQTNRQSNGNSKSSRQDDPADDDRLPWDMAEESEYLTKPEVGDLMNYAIRALGKDEAEMCLKKMYAYYKVTSESLMRADTSLYYGYIDKWGKSNVS